MTKKQEPTNQKANDKYERVVISFLLDHPFESVAIEQEDFFTPENQAAFKFIRSGAKDRVLLQEQMELAGFPNAVETYNITVPDIEQYVKSLVSMSASRKLIQMSEKFLRGEISIEDFQTETMNIRQYHKATPFSEMFSEEVISDFDKDKELATGFPTLDRNFHLIPGEFMIVAGETSIGKSQFGLNIAVNIAKAGYKVLIISLEMKRKHILSRLVSMELQFPIKYAFATSEEYKARVRKLMGESKWWLDNIILLDDIPGNLNEVLGAINAVKPDVAIVDYIQLMNVNGQMGDEKIVSQIASTMQNRCRDYRLIMISQLSRPTADGRNPLQRLKGSGALEYSASGIVYIGREPNGVNTYELMKNRTGMGEGVNLKVPFSAVNGRFDEILPAGETAGTVVNGEGKEVNNEDVVEGTLVLDVPFN